MIKRHNILLLIRICLFIQLTTIWLAAEAQQSKVAKLYLTAQDYLKKGDLQQAKSTLHNILSIDSNYAESHLVLADLYMREKDYPNASAHYYRVAQISPTLSSHTYLNLGESLLLSGKYKPALDALKHYESLFHDQPDQTQKSSKLIKDCLFSIDQLEHFHTENQAHSGVPLLTYLAPTINSDHDEYFPRLTADLNTMIFTRKINGIENFYQSIKNEQGQWMEASLLSGAVNSKQFNEGAHCISPDGKSLYFTGCNRPGGMGSCDIYVSHRVGDHWGTPRNLGSPINTSGWEAQPALSADGRTLYFVSNRKGGQGGYDIWKSELQAHGAWGTPENLGSQINTPFDESAPYIHADNQTLYFSSNGWPGFGDLDIFVSKRGDDGKWQYPSNMGPLVNNHFEQRAWSITMNGKQGYFSSRSHTRKTDLDIYMIELPENLQPVHVSYIKGRIIDISDQKTIHNAEIQLTDLSTEQISYTGISSLDEGSFLAPIVFGNEYALHIIHPGYLFHSSNYSLKDNTDQPDGYDLTVQLQPIEIGFSEILRNIFFDIGRYELLESSRIELDHLYDFLIKNQKIHIEIGGHTDNTGEEQSNQLLSEQRAQAVRDYLIQAGIPEHRITSKGYGQHKPIASNLHEASRKLNRRTDFRITSNE